MVRILERLGDRLLAVFVPSITAEAAGTAGCTYPNCGSCSGCQQRYRVCCNGTCGPCGNVEHCC
jgi:hypothetical protein